MTDSTVPALAISDLRHSFDGRRVLDRLSLEVRRGSITAVLGPSGGGKTTLLRIIAGFTRPDSGTVDIDGRRVTGDGVFTAPQDRNVGIVPQDGSLFPHLDVAANVAFGLDHRRSAAARARVAEMLELVGLPDAGRSMPSQLSGGMQQRIAIARALAPSPALLLLDEPFAALDAALRDEVREHVVDIIRAAGATTLWVTHDQDEALSTADEVAVLLDGRIAQSADPESLYRAPAARDVASFVGDSMVLEGDVAATGDVARTAMGEVRLAVRRAAGDVRVVLRPEQLEIVGAGDANATGTVVSRKFYGHDGTVVVRLDSGPEVSVRLHATLLPEVGATVGVRVNGPVLAFD